MNSAPRSVSWIIVLLFFTSLGGFGKGVNGLPCAPGLDCENTKCLSVSGLASCCTCISWDNRGGCLEWESSNGRQGTHCNFDVDMYHKTMTTLDSLGDDSCPANTACEDQRCRESNGFTECCMCTAWKKSGDCKVDGWRSATGDACILDGGQAPPTPMPEPGGCPSGVSCEDTKCRNHNGSNTCCRCHRWQPNGRCKASGWLKESGLGACDFSADNPTPMAKVVPHYTVVPRSVPLSYRGQEEPVALDNQVVNLPIEMTGQNKEAFTDTGDNNMGAAFSMLLPADQNSNSDGTVAAPADQNINIDPTSERRAGAVQGNNEGEGGNVSENGSLSSNEDTQNQMDGQPLKLRKLLVHRKQDCGLNVNCEMHQCYTMDGKGACCMCNKWDGGGRCVKWVSKIDGSDCTFSVSD